MSRVFQIKIWMFWFKGYWFWIYPILNMCMKKPYPNSKQSANFVYRGCHFNRVFYQVCKSKPCDLVRLAECHRDSIKSWVITSCVEGMGSCDIQCGAPHQWHNGRSALWLYTHYCDGMGCHVLCLQHGIPMWPHIIQNTSATSRHRRDMTSWGVKMTLNSSKLANQLSNTTLWCICAVITVWCRVNRCRVAPYIRDWY